MRLKCDFYLQPTTQVAQQLLGKFLIRKIGRKNLAGKIVETEAYVGPQDKASHASRGKTERNQIMFGPAGRTYIYFIYGMYYCLNVVTENKGYPAAVLIRAVEPVTDNKKNPKSEILNPKQIQNSNYQNSKHIIKNIANGPGKLCRYFKIDKSLNNENLITSHKIWIEDKNIKIPKTEIIAKKRIGVDYAGPYWSKRKLRFYIEN